MPYFFRTNGICLIIFLFKQSVIFFGLPLFLDRPSNPESGLFFGTMTVHCCPGVAPIRLCYLVATHITFLMYHLYVDGSFKWNFGVLLRYCHRLLHYTLCHVLLPNSLQIAVKSTFRLKTTINLTSNCDVILNYYP